MASTRYARQFAAAALVTLAAVVHAQSPLPMTIGILSSGTYEGRASLDQALMQGLRERGYVEGTNLTVVRRYGREPEQAERRRARDHEARRGIDDLHAVHAHDAGGVGDRADRDGGPSPTRCARASSKATTKPGRNVTWTASPGRGLLANKRLDDASVALAPAAKTVGRCWRTRPTPRTRSRGRALERRGEAGSALTPLRYDIQRSSAQRTVSRRGRCARGATA
jgi:hypothetical protein